MHIMQKYIQLTLVIVTSALFLHGCATPATPLKPNDDLAEGFGALMLVSNCPFKEGVSYFEIYRKGEGKRSGTTFRTEEFSAGTEFRVLKLPAGEYEFREFRIGSFTLRPTNPPQFTVYPGRINYFADMTFYDGGNGVLMTNYTDRSDQANNLLMTRYPELIAKYPLEVVAVDL